jgi:hypothetical protein
LELRDREGTLRLRRGLSTYTPASDRTDGSQPGGRPTTAVAVAIVTLPHRAHKEGPAAAGDLATARAAPLSAGVRAVATREKKKGLGGQIS